MTEQEFERKVEAAAERLEQTIEGTADRFDQALTRRWERKPFRSFLKSVSFAAELGLVAGSVLLSCKGRRVWAAVCLWLGIAGLLWHVFQLIFLRRERG